jgi:hypothetical protein
VLLSLRDVPIGLGKMLALEGVGHGSHNSPKFRDASHRPAPGRGSVAGMNARPAPIPLRPDPTALEREQHRSLIRAATATVLAARDGSNPAAMLKRTWPGDRGAELVLKAAASPLSTTDAPTLAVAPVAALTLLAPSSAALRLFATQTEIFLGQNATVRIPNVATPPVAVFVPELSPGPVVQAGLGTATLGPVKKIMLIAVVTEELQQAAPETASAVVGRVLAASIAKSIDAIAFDGAAGDDIRPAGLLNGVTPIAATAGGGVAAIATDLGNMAAAMATANIDPEGMIIVVAAKQATTLRLLAGPRFDNEIFGSTGLASGTVVAFARGSVASSFEGSPAIESSRSTTLHTANPASPLLALPTGSLFQTSEIAVKLRQRGTWAVIAPGGVQRINSTTW